MGRKSQLDDRSLDVFRCAANSKPLAKGSLRPSASHLHAGMTGHLLHILGDARIPRCPGALRANALYIQRELHLARFFELKRDRNLVALLERALEIEQHQMIPTRR